MQLCFLPSTIQAMSQRLLSSDPVLACDSLVKVTSPFPGRTGLVGNHREHTRGDSDALAAWVVSGREGRTGDRGTQWQVDIEQP